MPNESGMEYGGHFDFAVKPSNVQENAINGFQRLLSELPAMREQFGGESVDKAFVSFLLLTKELVLEMDGVRCPGSVAAIINRFSSIHSELDR